MEKEDSYYKLRDHLNNQPIGMRATRSEAEIRVLKHLFSSMEAEVATCLSHKLQPIETIFEVARHLVRSKEDLKKILDKMGKNGAIEFENKDGQRMYRNAPLVVGMFEYQVGKMTPEFIKDFDEYTSSRQFVTDFFKADPPQMRTIPIKKSIEITHNVSTFDEISTLMGTSDPPYVILECICRQKRELAGHPCKVTHRNETCLAAGPFAEMALEVGMGREISLSKAMEILELNQREGLVLQPSNTKKADFICSCCGCCCGILRMQQAYPKPVSAWSSNYYATVDENTCDGCGVCVDRCQVRAIRLSPETDQSVINLQRCIGCGACVVTCPHDAIELKKKEDEQIPPNSRDELLETILERKQQRAQRDHRKTN